MLKNLHIQTKCLLVCLLLCGSFFAQNAIAQPGNAIPLNGIDQAIAVNHPGNFSVGGHFTVEAWVKLANTTGTMAVLSTKRNENRGNSKYFELSFKGGNTINAYFNFVSVTNPRGNGGFLTSITDFAYNYKANTWYHVAITVNELSYFVYVNGKFIGSATFPMAGTDGYTADATLFGNTDIVSVAMYKGSDRLKGMLDELRIYDTTLNTDNIQTDMRSTSISRSGHLALYYNFNKYNATGDSVEDISTHKLNGFVTGTPPELKESYAMVVPIATAATNITHSGFIANWAAPETGYVTSYLLDVATDSGFNNLVAGYNALVVTATSQNVTGLVADSQYYYRVRADKPTVTGQGAFSNTIIVGKTKNAPTITAFRPKKASTDSVITITGANFTRTMAVTFGGTPAAWFKVIDAGTIKAAVGGGSTGNVAVTTPGGKAVKEGFSFKFIPVIKSFTPTAATTGQTVTITGLSLMDVASVSFGGIPAASFTMVSPTTLNAVVGAGASGKIEVTTAGGRSSKAGFIYTTCVPVAPSVTIAANTSNHICKGTKVMFTATPTNGGTPLYQWVKNKINVGDNSNIYTDSTLANGDSVWCILTSTAPCAAPTTAKSNKIVFGVSDSIPGQPSAIKGPTTVNYAQINLYYHVTKVKGVDYTWTVPAEVQIVDGQGTPNIQVWWTYRGPGQISVTESNYCGTSPASTISVVAIFQKPAAIKAPVQAANAAKTALPVTPYLKAYPNPAITTVTVEFTTAVPGKYQATLVNAVGQLINNTTGVSATGVNKITLDMTKYTAGMYYVRLLDAEHKTRIIKVVKAR